MVKYAKDFQKHQDHQYFNSKHNLNNKYSLHDYLLILLIYIPNHKMNIFTLDLLLIQTKIIHDLHTHLHLAIQYNQHIYMDNFM